MGQCHPDSAVDQGLEHDFVVAFFPGDLLSGDPDADAWDLHPAASWSAGAPHGGGTFSLNRGMDTGADELAAWLQHPDVLGRPVVLERGLYWVTVGGDRRVFPLYHVAVDAD